MNHYRRRARLLPNIASSGVPIRLLSLLLAAWLAAPAAAAPDRPGNALVSVDHAVLPGDRIELYFGLAHPAEKPDSFTIRQPARLVLDFPDTANATGKRRLTLEAGALQTIHIAEANRRTRVVLNLSNIPEHGIRVDGSTVIVSLGTGAGGGRPGTSQTAGAPFSGYMPGASTPDQRTVEGVDFRRGQDGQGRVLIDLSNPNIPVNVERRGDEVVVTLLGTRIPESMRQRLDVLDFATPIQYVDVLQRGDDGHIRIIPRTDDYEHLVYQAGDSIVVEVKERVEIQQIQADAKPTYDGEKLSLNFQDIGVRAVLSLLADFTSLNIVVSDSVGGNLTLRLKNVPWDQALDIILRAQGLGMRRNGNVIFVAPQEELAARKQARLAARQQAVELAPLRTSYIQINYAKASELAAILQAEKAGLLSERASVAVDERTNTLLVRATAATLQEVRRLVMQLDVPVRQVLIESRIVVATNDFSKNLGIRFGPGAVNDAVSFNDPGDIGFNVNVPVNATAGTATLALGTLPDGTLLGLELSAMQAEGRGEVISNPRVITTNQHEAKIEQGVEIPYEEATSSGATSISFKSAVLSLTVTPQITPDNRIIMNLTVTKDQVGEIFNGIPSIDTRAVSTQVIVDSGETVVLGGIYEEEETRGRTRVPFFADLPIIGILFQSKTVERSKSELLVFVTPKIITSTSGVEY